MMPRKSSILADKFVWLALAAFLVITVKSYEYYEWEAYKLGWLVCVEYFRQGVLYGGQPYCAQGPVIFVVGYVLQELFGRFIQEAAITTSILFNALALYFTVLIARHEGVKAKPGFIALLYVLLVYPSGIRYLASVVSMTILLLAYYALFHTNFRFKAALFGFLASAAMLTKFTSTILIAMFTLKYFYGRLVTPARSKDSVAFKVRLSIDSINQLLMMASSAVALFLLFNLIFPNIYLYTVNAQVSVGNHTFTQSLLRTIPLPGNLSVRHIPLYSLLILLALSYVRTKNTFSLIAAIAIPFNLVNAGRSLAFLHPHHALPALPFAVVGLLLFWDKAKQTPSRQLLFTLLFIYVAIFPSFTMPAQINYLRFARIDGKQLTIKDAVEGAIQDIPPQDGIVLVDVIESRYAKKFERLGAPIKPGQVRALTALPSHEIQDWGPSIRRTLNIPDRTTFINTGYEFREAQEISRQIQDGNVSLIIEGPPTWGQILAILRKNRQYVALNYCTVSIPSLEYFYDSGRHDTTLYFLNNSHCTQMRQDVRSYYLKNFQRLCDHDEYFTERFVNLVAFGFNGFTDRMECRGGGTKVSELSYDIDKIYGMDVALMAAVMLAVALSFLSTSGGRMVLRVHVE